MQIYIIFFTIFACMLHHFYLVDDIYDTKPTFCYQYLIIYSVDMNTRYAPVSPISPLISDMKNCHPIWSWYPIYRTLIGLYSIVLGHIDLMT